MKQIKIEQIKEIVTYLKNTQVLPIVGANLITICNILETLPDVEVKEEKKK